MNTDDEAARLDALHRYRILDTEAEPAFDDLTMLAARICETPIALITLVDGDRQWFKSRVGLSVGETSRSVAFCSHAIEQRDLFIVPDARADERFRGNPLVTGDPHIRFYAGAPLVTTDGHALGTICVIDQVPRALTNGQMEALAALKRQVEAQLELRVRLSEVRTLARALASQRTKLAEILAADRMGVWQWDFITEQGEWSDSLYRMFDLEPGTPATLEKLLSRVHPKDHDRTRRRLQTAIEKGSRFEGGDYRIIRADGSVRWIRDAGRVECAADGRPIRMSGIAQDITGRRDAEEALVASWERAERRSATQIKLTGVLTKATTVRDAAPQIMEAICECLDFEMSGLWLTDPADGLLRCVETWHSPRFDPGAFEAETRTLTLRPEQGLPGRAGASRETAWIADVTSDDNFPRRAVAARAGLTTGVAVPLVAGAQASGVLEFFTVNRREIDQDTLTTLDGLGTQVGQFIERMHAEDAVRRSEDRLRRILDSSLDAVVSMNGLGLVTLWSPQAAAMFGFTEEEAVGRVLADLIVPPHYRAAHAAGLRHYAASGEGPILSQRLELVACHKDRREFPVELSIAALRSWTSSTGAEEMVFSGFIRDTTARKRADEDLRRAKEDAEAMANVKSEFLAVMSHEIRTPLNGVIGMLNRVLELSPTEAQRDALAIAQSSAESLLAVTNDILDFSRMSAGKMVLEETAFDLSQIIDDVAASLRPQAKPGRVELRSRFPTGRPGGVIGDPSRLRQVLYSLVGNALKFTMDGYVEISVTAEPVAADGTVSHRIAVEDTGVGIPADRQASIFDAFTQADASTTRRFGGSGLGLSICAQLAVLMSGSVRLVRSSPAGSLFEVIVPLRPAALVPIQPPRGGAPRTFAGRVLVVEDNAVNQMIAVGMLRATGCSVDVAGNGVEAVAMVRQFKYDVIFMDCRMPEMDGYDATRAIRRLGPASMDALPIIAMTASALPEDRQRCLDAGMNDHVSKPILRKTIDDALERWLRPAGGGVRPVGGPAGVGPGGADMPTLNPDKLRDNRTLLSAGSATAWQELLDAFTEQGRTAIARLGVLLADKEFAAMQSHAHDLKGSAGMMGAARLAWLCDRLEGAAALAPAECGELVAAIRDEFASVGERLADDNS